MDLPDLFKLAKLTILAFKKKERGSPLKARRFEVQFNPATLTLKHESVFQTGVHYTGQRYNHTRAAELKVKLVLDGTQVGVMGIQALQHQPTVAEQVRDFLRACYRVHSDTHEAAYLTLRWGQGVLGKSGFDCRLKSAEVQYTAFNRDGSPLHAEIDAVFVEDVLPAKQMARDRLSSPDLTHRRVVLAGDTLPLLCQEIYGSATHYVAVAAFNGLDDFRVLEPGRELLFPPFERPGARG
jgi:hypothetical protein